MCAMEGAILLGSRGGQTARASRPLGIRHKSGPNRNCRPLPRTSSKLNGQQSPAISRFLISWLSTAHPSHKENERMAPTASGEQASTLLTSLDRKSTRLNSSHLGISYAVFCLKKKTS